MSKTILTDIEGTTSSIAFVKDVLFPYAAEKLPEWLSENRDVPAVRQQVEAVANEIGSSADDLAAVTGQLLEWIANDVKATPLKTLQGMLWKSGYENGDYQAHVYEDAVQNLSDWHAAGIPLYVYSSGSVQAQHLFFQYSRYGDLRQLFSGYFDTTTGAKTDAESYTKIAAAIDQPADKILFLSDVAAEVNAAIAAGCEAILVQREDNPDNAGDHTEADTAKNFFDVSVALAQMP